MTMGDIHLTKNSETMEMRQLVCKLHWRVSGKSNIVEFPVRRLPEIFEVLGIPREVLSKFKPQFFVEWKLSDNDKGRFIETSTGAF